MDHRPYEDWLLNDERLNLEQDRDLRLHLRNCPECAALANANLSLRSAAVLAPVQGFTLRFQSRLEAQGQLQRRRTVIGSFLLVMVGFGGFLWLLFPYLPYLTLPPAQLAGLWFGNLVYFALFVRALGVVGTTILNISTSLIPTYVWVLMLAVLGGFGLLWAISFRKIGKIVQSAA